MRRRRLPAALASLASLTVPAALATLALALISGCSDDPTFDAPDRSPGDRVPRTAACDGMDPLRCLLPWPSSTFTKADPGTATGIRVAVEAGSLYVADDPASLNRADGFSRATPLVAGFPMLLQAPEAGDPTAGPVRLVLAQPDHPAYGEQVPLRIEVRPSSDIETEALVIAYPLRPLEPGADYVAVVTDSLRAEGGAALSPSRAALVALDRAAPGSQDEADLRGYHAPTRAALTRAGIDPERVLRVWDFTTRSAEDATRRLEAMQEGARAAVRAGEVSVAIDKVEVPADGAVAALVEGRLVGVPSYTGAGEGGLTLDDDGLPMAAGAGEAPFRVMIPAGTGDYRFVMYGHGMGGSFRDGAFDAQLAGGGLAKVGIQLYGWTSDELIDTFMGFLRMAEGTHRSTARLMQALADGAAVQEAMVGPLGDALAAPMLGATPNPAAGRRPDGSTPVWAGGSLGGTMGLVYASADPEMRAAVLNVPGAGWTHFVPASVVYGSVEGLLKSNFGGDLSFLHALTMSQGNWDDIDGVAWVERLRAKDPAFLIQESMGDPVLPNPGSAMVAVVADALQVGAVLDPIVGLETASEAVGQSGITQYRVPGDDAYAVHGFAAEDGPAGDAARAQIEAYLLSVFAGEPRVAVPAGCAGGSCDFTKP